MTLDKQLFSILDKLSKKRFKKFEKYYKKDSKPFINKISRDYEKTGKFPSHILKTIIHLNSKSYDSAVCVLRGALPYSILFEAYGWKIHYVISGRKNESFTKSKRTNISVDKKIQEIKDKKVIFLENNIATGDSVVIALEKLKKRHNLAKPDLFLDYFCDNKKYKFFSMKENKNYIKKFGEIFEAKNTRVSRSEHQKLIKDCLDRVRRLK
jgi:uracil phosphoribosyltransferase